MSFSITNLHPATIEFIRNVSIGLLLAWLVSTILFGVLRWLAHRVRRVTVLDATFRLFRRGTTLILSSMAGRNAIYEAHLATAQLVAANQVVETLRIAGFAFAIYGVWELICEQLLHRPSEFGPKTERLLIPVTRKLVRALIIGVSVLIVAAELSNVNLSTLIASLGIGGLVVALAAKDSMENLFGSLTILFDTPFTIGDWIKTDKVEGVVEEINLRSTRIRSFEDTLITLPNANLIRAAVENFGARRARRQKLSLKLSYRSDPEALEAFRRDVLVLVNSIPGVQAERTIVDLETLEDAAVGMLLQCYLEVKDQAGELERRNQIIGGVLRLARERKIEFAVVATVPPLN